MTPGITALAAAQAETVVRTTIAYVANAQKLSDYSDQGVAAIEWVAVLDDATTPICEELDGKQWLIPDDPEDYEGYIPIGHDIPFPGPIAHWNCRSAQIPADEDGAVLAESTANGRGES
jgi:SPP1 gp7 family putative phage head morphogenesis protein